MPLPNSPPLAMPRMPWPLCQPVLPKSENGSAKLVRRDSRSALTVASTSAITPTPLAAATKIRIGAPATKSIPSAIANSTSPVPRSLPRPTTSPVITATIGSTGISTCL